MLDENLSTIGYKPGFQVVVEGKSGSDNLYLINESGIIKSIKNTVIDHVQDGHVTVEGITWDVMQGDEWLHSALSEVKSGCVSLSNKLTEGTAGLQACKTLAKDVHSELATAQTNGEQ